MAIEYVKVNTGKDKTDTSLSASASDNSKYREGRRGIGSEEYTFPESYRCIGSQNGLAEHGLFPAVMFMLNVNSSC